MSDNKELYRQLQGVIAGNQQDFANVFKCYYTVLVRYAYSFIKNKEAAEDIVQEFFCKLWLEKEKLKQIRNFDAFIYVSIKNISLNYLRDKKIKINIDVVHPAEENTILADIVREEIYTDLIAAIRQLPLQCRTILFMKLEGADNKTISHDLNIAEETVRSQIRRGISILKSTLRKDIFIAFIFTFGILRKQTSLNSRSGKQSFI